MDNIYKLHGVPQSIVSNRDKIFLINFWKKLFKLLGATLKLSTAYHPQTDGQTEVTNMSLETYPMCMSSECPKDWCKWLPLAKWWYNTTHHTTLNTTPYQAMYGQAPPIHMSYILGDSKVEALDRSLQQRETAIKLLKFHLLRAQQRMKHQADKGRSDKQFQLDDFVYLKLQPYRQKSIINRACLTLFTKYCGPYRMIAKIGQVAYQLELPPETKIPSIFHVSQFKKHVGHHFTQLIAYD